MRVHVYEHMPSVGRKLLLAGRSGLNLTHAEPLPALLARYGSAAIVQRAVREFPPDALRAWCAGLGEATYVGSSGRVFPTSFRATPLLRAWLARLHDLDVRVHVRHRWLGWAQGSSGDADPHRHHFRLPDGSGVEVAADVSVFALGGASWPRVGSDGAWVAPFREAGCDVRTLHAANCALHLDWSAHFAERFAGVPLKNVELRVGSQRGRGDAMVTTAGLESGPVYGLVPAIRAHLDAHGS